MCLIRKKRNDAHSSGSRQYVNVYQADAPTIKAQYYPMYKPVQSIRLSPVKKGAHLYRYFLVVKKQYFLQPSLLIPSPLGVKEETGTSLTNKPLILFLSSSHFTTKSLLYQLLYCFLVSCKSKVELFLFIFPN